MKTFRPTVAPAPRHVLDFQIDRGDEGKRPPAASVKIDLDRHFQRVLIGDAAGHVAAPLRTATASAACDELCRTLACS
jgi:hypothetical protein